MKLTFILVGKIKEHFYEEGIKMYIKRISKYSQVEFINLDESRLSTSTSKIEIDRGLDEEAEKILSKIESNSSLILFDTKGKEYDSAQFSNILFESQITKSHMYFVIGSSNGLSDKVRKKAALRVKMSSFTFTHPEAMLIATEAVYRAFKIHSGESYHK